MHDDDGTAAGRQNIKGLPYHVLRDQGRFRVRSADSRSGFIVVIANRFLAPLVAADVDEHPHEPRLFLRGANRYRPDGPRRPEKRLLDEVECVVYGGRDASGETVETIMMNVEQGRKTLGRSDCQFEGKDAHQRLAVHISLNG